MVTMWANIETSKIIYILLKDKKLLREAVPFINKNAKCVTIYDKNIAKPRRGGGGGKKEIGHGCNVTDCHCLRQVLADFLE